MKKYALGIHHLNIGYTVGQTDSYHRQVRESVMPLIDLLARHPTWCFSIEMSGFSIEFIALNYPALLQRIRLLIDSGQIELISSTYSPQIWIAFPKTDLVKSIEMNQKLLKEYGLPATRIFFAQENFSGEGMRELSEWFDIAIVKDDYYFYFHPQPDDRQPLIPYYQLGDLKVLVGWGHILEHLHDNAAVLADNGFIRQTYSAMLAKAAERQAGACKLTGYTGTWKSLQWQWYHIGSSERFAKPHMRPEQVAWCRFDPDWHFYLERHLMVHERQGYSFTGVRRFVDDLSSEAFEAAPCKLLPDGAWNMENSQGGFVWMGLNGNAREDDLLVRNQNWRSRARLLGMETLVELLPEGLIQRAEFQDELAKAWKHQVLSEASDATGWYADGAEVAFSIQQSEHVLNTVARLANLLKLKSGLGLCIVDTLRKTLLDNREAGLPQPVKIATAGAFVEASLFGGRGQVSYYQAAPAQQRIEVDFVPAGNRCGVAFPLGTGYILFSPALMEHTTVRFPLEDLKPQRLYLPLPNGLIALEDNLFVIKHNEFMNIACCVDRMAARVSFEVENPKETPIRWCLTVFKGELQDAVDLALSINVFPTVYL